MKTLLLISSERGAGSLDELHAIPGLRVIPRRGVAEAISAINAGVFDLSLFFAPAWGEDATEEMRRLRAAAPQLPILIATEPAHLVAAYASGCDAALPWPDSGPLIGPLVQRWTTATRGSSRAAPSTSASVAPWPVTPVQSHSALEILRDFSKVLSHALDERSLAQRLVEQLAEILGVVRIALFLEMEGETQPVPDAFAADPRLACSAAIGIPAEVTACVELSRDGGLGRLMTQRRGVFSRYSPHGQADLQGDLRILQEFEVLGCDMAISIRDRDKVIGVAVLGERITGQPFTTEELNLGYFLMGELGMAIRNSRLHRMLALNHQLLSSVLESSTAGSLVVGADLRVLHANHAASALLGITSSRLPSVSDLPPPVLQTLHAVVTQSASAEPMLQETTGSNRRLLRFGIIPLQGSGTTAPSRPVIVMIEDWTKIQAMQQAEIESANAKLIATIAARFAHEIRNSLVPLSTHSQLFATEIHNASFVDSLRSSLHRETLRIRRLSDQMLFLATSEPRGEDLVRVADVVTDALAAAQDIASKAGQLTFTGDRDLSVKCLRTSLTYALQEILANSLQSVAGPATIKVQVMGSSSDGKPAVVLAISDSGGGFSAETAARATEPFYTTRTTGVGLGLAVARKIIEQHGGRLAIHARGRAQADLEITLPAT